jgi:hypothetical protein
LPTDEYTIKNDVKSTAEDEVVLRRKYDNKICNTNAKNHALALYEPGGGGSHGNMAPGNALCGNRYAYSNY